MLKRLRKKHPIGYCVGAEVIFLGVMMLASFILTLGFVLFCDDLSGIEDYLLTALQELAGVAEENWVLTVEFGEIWDGEFWRVEESWMEWKEFLKCVFGLDRVEYKFGKGNAKGE